MTTIAELARIKQSLRELELRRKGEMIQNAQQDEEENCDGKKWQEITKMQISNYF